MSESPTFTFVGAPYLEYLPVVDLATGRLLGMEALVRWQHPQQGRISPDELIPQAEATGDIAPLTRWVLMEALQPGPEVVAEHPTRSQLHRRAAAPGGSLEGGGRRARRRPAYGADSSPSR